MKKNIFVFFIICFATFFVARLYLHPGFPYTHDGENHLARFANYILAVREHQFPPRFAPNLFDHFGYPVFNYNYPLANILSLPFSFLHLNYEVTFKILTTAFIAFGLLGTFLWLKNVSFSFWAQIFGMILFALSPYLLNSVYFRGNIGEIAATCLLPWLFWTIEKLNASHFFKSPLFLFSIALWSAFSLSHNIAAVFGLPILIFYAVLRLRKKSEWLRFIAILSFSVILTLWFWLPAIAEKNAIVVDSANVTQQFLDQFSSIDQLLFVPMRFGFSYGGPVNDLSASVGIVQFIILILACVYVIKKILMKKGKVPLCVVGLLVLLTTLFLFQLPFTKPIWMIFFAIAKYLQFPWRLSMFWEILILPISAYLFDHVPRIGKFFLALILLWQVIGFSRIHPVDYFHRDIQDYDYFTQSTSTNNENRSRTFTYVPTDSSQWQPTPTFLEGSGQVRVQSWRGSSRQYTLTITSPTVIVEPTMNFLGWETWLRPAENNEKFLVKYIDSPAIGGRIAYHVGPGTYSVDSSFTQHTWAREVGNSVSSVGIVALVIGTCWVAYEAIHKKHV